MDKEVETNINKDINLLIGVGNELRRMVRRMKILGMRFIFLRRLS